MQPSPKDLCPPGTQPARPGELLVQRAHGEVSPAWPGLAWPRSRKSSERPQPHPCFPTLSSGCCLGGDRRARVETGQLAIMILGP